MAMELLILAVLVGLIPAMVARSKGRDFVLWWIYGGLLFIIALPHALLLKAQIKDVEQQQAAQGFKKCPFCAEMIKPDAKVCRYCGRDLPGATVAATRPEEEPAPNPEEASKPEQAASVPARVVGEKSDDPTHVSGSPLPGSESFPKAKLWTPPPWERSGNPINKSSTDLAVVPLPDEPPQASGETHRTMATNQEREERIRREIGRRLASRWSTTGRPEGVSANRFHSRPLVVVVLAGAFLLVITGAYMLGRRAPVKDVPAAAPTRALAPSPTQGLLNAVQPEQLSRASAPSSRSERATRPPTTASSGTSSLSPTQTSPVAAAKSQVAAPSKADEAAGDSADHTPRAVGAQQFLGECAARLPANQLITLNLKDANIQTTLRLFAQQYRVNVLSTDDVKGTITLDFFRVPAREAFQKIIDTGNLRCAMTGEILRVSMVAQSKEVTAPPTRAWAAPLSRATSTPALATSTAEATAAARSTGQPTPFPAPQQPTLQAGRPPEPPVPAEYHAGLNAAEAKDWLGAERAYRDALQKSPSNPEIWYKLGVALGQQKRRSDAIAAYREALRLNTGHVNSWYNLGLELSRERGYAAALAAFTEVTRLEPTNARGWKIRGSLHTMNKEFPQAISALHEAIRLKPDDAETWYDLTYLHVLTSNPRAATEAYARLMQLDPAKAGQFRKEVLLAGTATTPAPQSSVDRQELSPTTR